jgi:uncharacterized damage-inducible protein DinB
MAVRESTLALLRRLPPAAWNRHGTASGFRATVRGLAFTIAGHELHHRKILEDRYVNASTEQSRLTTARTPWFARQFAFPLPVELLPNVLERLSGTPARLEELVRGRSRELLTKRRSEKWSAQEHVGHLLDLEPLWLARVDDYLTGKDQLTAADLTNRKTDEANHNGRLLEQILAEFRLARQVLLKRVDEFAAPLLFRATPHPRLGTPMRLVDHLYFVAEHDDHHLAAVSELLGRAD